MSFTFKICQTVAGTSITIQFHNFLKLYFRRVFAIRPTVRGGSSDLTRVSNHAEHLHDSHWLRNF